MSIWCDVHGAGASQQVHKVQVNLEIHQIIIQNVKFKFLSEGDDRVVVRNQHDTAFNSIPSNLKRRFCTIHSAFEVRVLCDIR